MLMNLTLQQLGYLSLIFIAVTGAVVGVAMVFTRAGDLKLRVREMSAETGPAPGEIVYGWRRRLAELLAPLARLAESKEGTEISIARARFMQAGWRSPSAPAIFFGLKAVLALLLPMLGLAAVQVFGLKLDGAGAPAMLLILAAAGYYVPNVRLAGRIAERRRRLFEAFPDAIDLIIVCIEAGLGLDMAIARSAREMSLRSQDLADELNLIGVELRMGASRDRALRSFAARTGVEEISMFVSMILQADRFGTSIADALRVHAEELRLRRRLRAEEQAAKIPLKLLFPLIFCIFPSLLLVLLGPAFIQIYRTLHSCHVRPMRRAKAMCFVRCASLLTLFAGLLLGGCATTNPPPLMMKNFLEPVTRVEGETATADQVYQSGRSALLSGDLVAAGRLFSQTLVLEPDYLDAINGLAAILTIQGRYADSLALMRQAAERAPDNGMFRRNVARVEALSRRAQATESPLSVLPLGAAAPDSAASESTASESDQVLTSSASAAVVRPQQRQVEPTPASIAMVGSNVYQLAPARMAVALRDGAPRPDAVAPPPLAAAEASPVSEAPAPREVAASSDSAVPRGVPSATTVPAAVAAHRPRARSSPPPSVDERLLSRPSIASRFRAGRRRFQRPRLLRSRHQSGSSRSRTGARSTRFSCPRCRLPG